MLDMTSHARDGQARSARPEDRRVPGTRARHCSNAPRSLDRGSARSERPRHCAPRGGTAQSVVVIECGPDVGPGASTVRSGVPGPRAVPPARQRRFRPARSRQRDGPGRSNQGSTSFGPERRDVCGVGQALAGAVHARPAADPLAAEIDDLALPLAVAFRWRRCARAKRRAARSRDTPPRRCAPRAGPAAPWPPGCGARATRAARAAGSCGRRDPASPRRSSQDRATLAIRFVHERSIRVNGSAGVRPESRTPTVRPARRRPLQKRLTSDS